MMTDERMIYLKELEEEFGIDLEIIVMLADLLGPSEDHDGLIISLEDYQMGI